MSRMSTVQALRTLGFRTKLSLLDLTAIEEEGAKKQSEVTPVHEIVDRAISIDAYKPAPGRSVTISGLNRVHKI